MNRKKYTITATVLNVLFLIWTLLIKTVDVQAVGTNGSLVGFARINTWFHSLTGVHMTIYTITDWFGLIPFVLCAVFGFVGLIQWIKRKKLLEVDRDIIVLGIYYILVIAFYFFFEFCPMNYRPILIEGAQESSYPSSTILLVLTVMPSVIFQVQRRINNKTIQIAIVVASMIFTIFTVVARLLCGVHWLTDIIGGLLLSSSLFNFYLAVVLV